VYKTTRLYVAEDSNIALTVMVTLKCTYI